jgi:hypothetical protein
MTARILKVWNAGTGEWEDVAVQQPALAIPYSLLDAKGDIIAASGADTAAKVTVGADGTVLTAYSTEPSGVKWAAASSGGWYRSYLMMGA